VVAGQCKAGAVKGKLVSVDSVELCRVWIEFCSRKLSMMALVELSLKAAREGLKDGFLVGDVA